MNQFMPYDPGVVPSKNSPNPGEKIVLQVAGLPPYKDTNASIRNSKHNIHSRFKALREAGINAMEGRAPFRGPIQLDFKMYAKGIEPKRSLEDYVGGIMDTLDGSHGPNFTYLPIAYEDDCQVCAGSSQIEKSSKEHYDLVISFLKD